MPRIGTGVDVEEAFVEGAEEAYIRQVLHCTMPNVLGEVS